MVPRTYFLELEKRSRRSVFATVLRGEPMVRGKSQNPTSVEELEEMTVVVFKLKGRGETLRKGFDLASEAFGAVGGSSAQQKLLRTPLHQPRSAEKNGTPAIDVVEDQEELDEAEATTAPQREVSAPKKRSYPKFLDKLKLDGDGTKWKEYAAQKNPKTENEKYLVACAWITKHGGQPVFTRDYVFTCFQTMGWTIQTDFTQPMRAMKLQKSYFADTGDRGKWKLTDHGL